MKKEEQIRKRLENYENMQRAKGINAFAKEIIELKWVLLDWLV